MLHVGIDGHLAHLGMELEVEIETVVRIDRGYVGDLSFLEERQFQYDFFHMRGVELLRAKVLYANYGNVFT